MELDEAEVIGVGGRIMKDGAMIYIHPATEVHHKRGRVGSLLTDPSLFMAVSRTGHEWIHFNTGESYAKGYMLPR